MLQRIADSLRASERVLVTAHRRPDGDALGSSLALAVALREMGREVLHLVVDPIPYNLRFLPGVGAVTGEIPEGERFDLAVTCDTPTRGALPDALWARRGDLGSLVSIDHHAENDGYADLTLLDPSAAATGVLVYRILHALDHPISAEVAKNLYVAILTDTGSFRYDSTDPECLRVTSELLATGLRPWEIASRVYESQPEARLRLLAETLSTLELSCAGRFATLTVRQETLQACGATVDMLDGFVNHARSVDGVEVAALFVELPEGGFKVSFRSRGNVPLDDVGRRLGGKGSRNAASARVDGDLEIAKTLASEAVRALLPAPENAVA